MKIRAERAGDKQAISRLVTAAFAVAHHSDGTEASIVERLGEAGALTISLVAEEDGQIVGYIAFSPVTIDGRDVGWFGLGPVAVQPQRQGRGLGSTVIRDGLEQLRETGAAGCVLVGEPTYYGRFGFAAEDALIYPGLSAQYFQALSFTGETPRGTVAYHPAFG